MATAAVPARPSSGETRRPSSTTPAAPTPPAAPAVGERARATSYASTPGAAEGSPGDGAQPAPAGPGREPTSSPGAGTPTEPDPGTATPTPSPGADPPDPAPGPAPPGGEPASGTPTGPSDGPRPGEGPPSRPALDPPAEPTSATGDRPAGAAPEPTATAVPGRRPATQSSGLTLDTLTQTVARATSTDELLRRSSATIDSALQAGAAGGGGAAGAGIIVRILDAALQRDENGHTVFDAKELSLVEERRKLEAELRRRGLAPDLVQRLMSNIIEQGQVQREREKIEGLLALMVSITFGNIPKGLVNRLVELGLGPEVERAMRDAIGNGRHLSRGAIRDLMSLASSGLGNGPSMPSVGTAPEHQVEDYYRDEDRRIARTTATGGARMLDPSGRPAGAWTAGARTLSDALRTRAASSGDWTSPSGGDGSQGST